MHTQRDTDFGDLKGCVLTEISGLEVGSDCVRFYSADGRSWELYHEQDCCEDVAVEEIHGDIADLIGTEILSAEEVSSEGAPAPEGADDSYTWTFYRLMTIRGAVQIRWLGQSNGYYSEHVSFARLDEEKLT